MRTVAIFGFAPETRDIIHGINGETEVWSVNWAYRFNPPRIDRLFDVHLPEYLKDDKTRDLREHWQWLQQEHDFPIYMVEQMPEVPSSVAYPIDEISERVFSKMTVGPDNERDDYWVSGISYAMGMAIDEGVDRIELYGVEMERGTDVVYQRDGIALLCGLAMGRGIEVWRPEQSSFLKAKRYGFEATQMVSRASLEEHLGHYRIDEQLVLANLNRINGIVQERERALKAERNKTKRKDWRNLIQNAERKRAELQEKYQMILGAIQAIEHLIRVADLEEPELMLEPQMKHADAVEA